MTKPLINLDELDLSYHEDGQFQQRFGVIGDQIGAQKLGYNLTVVPPGKKACPFHNHRVNEEMFFILEGEGLLRFGEQTHVLRVNDVIACPPGDREVAHQIINTGDRDLRYLAISTRQKQEICEYPDSNKIGVYITEEGANTHLRLLFKEQQAVDYMDGE